MLSTRKRVTVKDMLLQEPKMLESAAPCAECQDGRDLSGMSIFLLEEG